MCIDGAYNEQEFTDSCNFCPYGWTTLQPASTSHRHCKLSKKINIILVTKLALIVQILTCFEEVNVNFNLDCSRGYYVVETGDSYFEKRCEICPEVSYSVSVNASTCTQCPRLTVSRKGSTSQGDCRQASKRLYT